MESRLRTRAVVAGLMVAACGLQLACIDEYGWFRDELYYLACGAHPALGYVDHPPLIGWVAWLVRHGLGDSFLAVRMGPVLAGAGIIGVTARLAEKLGARGAGVILAGLAAWLAPTYLFLAHHLSMNGFEVLLWSIAALLVLDLAPRWRWLLLGLVVGVGLLNKHSMAFWVVAVVCGMLLTDRRRWLRGRGPFVAAAAALALVSPHVAWQVLHDFPTLNFYRNASAHKILPMTPWGFVGAQLTLAGPGNALLWLGGLIWLLVSPAAKHHRFLGIAYLVLLVLLVALGGKAYYLLPFYPVLFAAGGAGLERVSSGWTSARRKVFVTVSFSVVFCVGIAVAPLALPILPVEASIAWMRTLGLSAPKAERAEVAELPQPLADMFGWPELVRSVASVYAGLPQSDRALAQVVAMNYGQAAAIDWLGRSQGLPPALSPHNAYWGWGTPVDGGGAVIVIGVPSSSRAVLEGYFERVEVRTTTQCSFCMPHERGLPVYVCRGWRVPPERVWAEMQRYR
jgi:4-amino-4-deoxy-L-arabinose transferase-like glycosyltransferase